MKKRKKLLSFKVKSLYVSGFCLVTKWLPFVWYVLYINFPVYSLLARLMI
ncbi:MAG: hypothetical protein SOR57_02620 [Parabacteroides sp.]|nr:hypothetical protein [Parabacteroides sp.]